MFTNMSAAIRFCAKSFLIQLTRTGPKHNWLSSASVLGICKYPLIQKRFIAHTKINYKKRKSPNETNDKTKVDGAFPKKTKNKITTFGVVDIWRNMTVADLASTLNKSIDHVQEVMLYVKGADNLDPTARLEDLKITREIAIKCGLKTKVIAAPSANAEPTEIKDKDVFGRPPAPEELLKVRPPVVTVMGHVDHGKTTLLDSLRGASIAAGEAGGITQHIGAFTVTLENGELVTFLDTPGHAAFSAMRARGVHCTDIIVLVIAAEDGVMQQTKEVIKLAEESNVPIIVAVNKIDRPGADVEETKRDLIQMGLALEGHGGDAQVVPISALLGTNLDQLADAVSTQATLMGLKSDYTGLVEGVVVEVTNDSRRGKLATIIVKRGTLRKGSIIVSGIAHAKVRGLFDHTGQPIEQATPGMPVEIIGWRELPFAGDEILEVETERKAHSVLQFRQSQKQLEKAVSDLDGIRAKEELHASTYRTQRENRILTGYRRPRLATRPKESTHDDTTPRVNLVLKGDVHGSVEAILDVLDTYHGGDKCRLDVVHYGVGDVTDGDVELARTFKAFIYAFTVKPPQRPAKGVVVREFNVIYRLVEDLKAEINARLPDIEVDEIIGEANVLQIFMINEGRKEVPVFGCRCTKGLLKKSAKVRVVRNGEVIYDGQFESIRHLKNEVETIKKDVECGLRMADVSVVGEPGDTIVCYRKTTETQTTDWDPGF